MISIASSVRSAAASVTAELNPFNGVTVTM
jgi:hypothetical protein